MAGKIESKDVQCMKNILSEMNVKEYDPNVPQMLLEVARRYVVDMLDDAKILAQMNGRKSIEDSDVRGVAKLKLDNYFTRPPPRELLLETARMINSNPLPPIKPFSGPKFPPDRYCLTNPNYELTHKKPTSGSVKQSGKFGSHFHSME